MGEYNIEGNNGGTPSVLITGGTGLVGRYLTSLLLAEGYKVSHLSRKNSGSGRVSVFRWDPAKEELDPEALDGVDYLIHLSGANIGEKRWSPSRKKEIIDSRVDSCNFLFRTVRKNNHKLKAFITASAVGYYGSVTSERIFTEDDPAASDFLGTTCRLWEEGAAFFEASGIRSVRLRTGVVLEPEGGALASLLKPAKAGFVVRLGSGNQYFPWIHIEDLCNIYLQAIRNPLMSGAYNAVAPEFITHNDFVSTMAKVIGKKVFLPSVPEWVLRTVLGEMADIVLRGSRISAVKITGSGYKFRFHKSEDALKNLIPC